MPTAAPAAAGAASAAAPAAAKGDAPKAGKYLDWKHMVCKSIICCSMAVAVFGYVQL